MYCRNCGNKLLDTDKFCNKCGYKVILDKENLEEQKNIERNVKNKVKENTEKVNTKVESKEINLPMNWWNFWQYFKFPVGLALYIFHFIQSLIVLKESTINIYGVLLLILYLALIFLFCVAFYCFIQRKKNGFKILIIYSIAEIIYNSFISIFSNTNLYHYSFTEMFIMVLLIAGITIGIWGYPNYVYFNKRKHLFKN